MDEYFRKALSDFSFDMASGREIAALTDKGYTVENIAKRLDYPTPLAKIQRAVWKRLLETETIVFSPKSGYIPCDFGILQREDPAEYARRLSLLNDRQREYVEGLPWEGRICYHRADHRMKEIEKRLAQSYSAYIRP